MHEKEVYCQYQLKLTSPPYLSFRYSLEENWTSNQACGAGKAFICEFWKIKSDIN
jgi:hypothetical protein